MPGPGSAVVRDADEARAILVALLESAYESADEARAALERALQGANRDEFPTSVPDVLAFVRTGLLPVLSDDLGPRLTMALMDDFIAAHESRSGVRKTPRASVSPFAEPRHLRVLLVDADRIGRTTLARGLARERCLVTIAASLEELGEVVRTGEPVDAVLLDGQHPARLLLLEMIVDRFPAAAIVVRSTAEDATRALLHSLGVTRFEVQPIRASPEALVAAVWRVAAGEP